jgi:hypothetical protein
VTFLANTQNLLSSLDHDLLELAFLHSLQVGGDGNPTIGHEYEAVGLAASDPVLS